MSESYAISETNIIRFLLYNESYKEKTIQHITSNLFDDAICGDIFSIIHSLFMKGEPVTDNNVVVIVMNNPWSQPADVIKKKLAVISISEEEQKYYKLSSLDENINSTEIWWKRQAFTRMISEGIDMLKNTEHRDLKKLEGMINDIYAFDITKRKELVFNPLDNQKMIDYYSKEEELIKFYNPHINELFGGGLKKKTLSVFMGGVHKGKTRMLISLACDMCRASVMNNVLYVSLEIDKMSVSEKIDMNFLGVKVSGIRDMVKASPDQYVKMRNEAFSDKGKLYVQEYPSGSFCAADLLSLCENMKRIGIPISVVFVDYIQLMRPNDPKMMTSLYDKGVFIAQELRAFSMRTEIPAVVAVQPTREGNMKVMKAIDEASMMDVGESKAISDTCDYFGIIVMTKVMKQQHRQVVYTDKNRMSGITDRHMMIEYDRDLYISRVIGLTSDSDEEEENEKPYQSKEQETFIQSFQAKMGPVVFN